MDFVNKIFSKKVDDSVHEQFVRFGKGVYNDRGVIRLQKSADKVKVSSTFEYSKDFAELLSNLAGSFEISGIIMSKEPISDLLRKESIKAVSEEKKGGLFHLNNIQSQKIEASKLKSLLSQAKYALLNAKTEGIEFKCKQKLPKPGKGEGKADDKFCQLNAEIKYWPKVREAFFLDIPENAKKAYIKHTFEISNIIAPKDMKDFEQMRLLAKRAGKLTRIIEIDKKETKREVSFEA